jgi:hypothetical protein
LKYSHGFYLKNSLFLLSLLFCGVISYAQSNLTTGNPAQITTIQNAPQRDTNLNKTNTNKWKNAETQIHYEQLNSSVIRVPDTPIHVFHRRPFLQPWKRDIGNLGSPANDLMFTPEYRVGPTLGYHVFDAYRNNVDSLRFYNTTKPYSVFIYQLGSRLEQVASVMHTQNIRPNWNFAVEYRKTTSPGFYKIQRTNNDNAALTTNYKSLNKRYSLYGAMVYNKQQNDENGGIIGERLSKEKDTLDIYFDRRTIPVTYQSGYSQTRSSVSNVLRDFTGLFQHAYTWGRADTLYNEDSTQYRYSLVPRFSISHKMELSTEKRIYKDYTPDSMRYATYFNSGFAGTDSVFSQQKWFWIDNRVMLNGFIGKEGSQLKFSAGVGNRYDMFVTTPALMPIPDSLPKVVYGVGEDRSKIVSNYIAGSITKEALDAGEWDYRANTQLFFTGRYAGNLFLNASIGKGIKRLGSFAAGVQQHVNSAPYNYTIYGNQYVTLTYNHGLENVTLLYGTLESSQLKLSGGVRNYLIANYIYVNQKGIPSQYSTPFTVSQAWARKVFRVKYFLFDNELVAQQRTGNGPINIPTLMGRHQASYESALFRKAIDIATGVEVRYNTPYAPAGYSPILNRFFYQDNKTISNKVEMAVFLNFRVKRFRAYLMCDQLQQTFFTRNTILFTGVPYINSQDGTTVTPVYAAPDLNIRFGFNWVLVN